MANEPAARSAAAGRRDAAKPTRVALIARGSLYRNAIENLLREQAWVELVGVVTPEDGAARLLARTEPEIVVVGEEARLPALCDASPDARLILMRLPESLAGAAKLIEQGVAAFISAGDNRLKLEAILTAVASGHTLLPPGSIRALPTDNAETLLAAADTLARPVDRSPTKRTELRDLCRNGGVAPRNLEEYRALMMDP